MTRREILARLAEIVDPRQHPARWSGPRASQIEAAEYREWADRNHDLAMKLFLELRREADAEERTVAPAGARSLLASFVVDTEGVGPQ